MAAPSLDSYNAAIAAQLTGVGTLALVSDRTPKVPYAGPTPALFTRPLRVHRAYIAGRAKMDVGHFELTYIDATPKMQQLSIEQIETAMYNNREAIYAALEANITLSGQLTIVADEADEFYNPNGPYIEWLGAMWVGFQIHISFRGKKFTV
ncbi:MAG TPA: hypothetical protein VFE42_20660 [Chloroflexota bacterium]|nr:hypothetical protein [Chloroflexota bacterium]HZS89890.1 hypothetical protein [Chloroflexota bacterium]